MKWVYCAVVFLALVAGILWPKSLNLHNTVAQPPVDPYFMHHGIHTANVVLADPIRVCYERETLFVNSAGYAEAIQDAISIWNTALQNTESVAEDNPLTVSIDESQVFLYAGEEGGPTCLPRGSTTKIDRVIVKDGPSSDCIGTAYACTIHDKERRTGTYTANGKNVILKTYTEDTLLYINGWEPNDLGDETPHARRLNNDGSVNSEYRHLLKTLVHELGHVLGMAHYDCPEVANPYFRVSQDANGDAIVTALASGPGESRILSDEIVPAQSCATTYGGGAARIEPVDVDDFRLMYPEINGRTQVGTHASCPLAVVASPTTGGTVTGSGSAPCGKTRTNLTATASTATEPDYVFDGWSGGGCSGTFCRPIVGTLGGSAERVRVTGNFVQYCTISVKVGTGQGSVSMEPADGRVRCGAGKVKYTATPSTGYCFSGWGTTLGATGQVGCETSGSREITPLGDFTFTANFERKQCTLTVEAGTRGKVTVGSTTTPTSTASWTGNCGTQLSGTSGANAAPVATANATPAPGYRFTGWTSSPPGWTNGCSGTGACTPTVGSAEGTTQAFTLTATFAPQCTLSVDARTGGSATIGATATSWTGDCGTQLTGNTALKATATTTPAPGYRFTRWTETPITWVSRCGSSATCTPTIGSATGAPGTYGLTASFTPRCTLTVRAGTGGSATIGATTATSWTGDCGTRLRGSSAPRATANSGYSFTGWSSSSGWTSGCSGTGTCTPTVGSATGATRSFTLTASFARRIVVPPPPTRYQLNATAGTGGRVDCFTGGGTVVVNCEESFTAGTVVTVTATGSTTQTDEYVFRSWGGCDSANGATCTMTMNVAKTVWARFTHYHRCTVTSAVESGQGTVTPGATVRCGTPVSIYATAADGWCFSRWGYSGLPGPTQGTASTSSTCTKRGAVHLNPAYPHLTTIGAHAYFRRQSGTSGQEDSASDQDAGGTATATATTAPAPTATATPSPTPTPTATPSATATPTPTATATPSPTATPTPSPTPSTTATPSPTATPTPSPTPAP